jgi:hypothetical protein
MIPKKDNKKVYWIWLVVLSCIEIILITLLIQAIK